MTSLLAFLPGKQPRLEMLHQPFLPRKHRLMVMRDIVENIFAPLNRFRWQDKDDEEPSERSVVVPLQPHVGQLAVIRRQYELVQRARLAKSIDGLTRLTSGGTVSPHSNVDPIQALSTMANSIDHASDEVTRLQEEVQANVAIIGKLMASHSKLESQHGRDSQVVKETNAALEADYQLFDEEED